MATSAQQQQDGEMTPGAQRQGGVQSCCRTPVVTPLRHKGLLGWRYDCKCNYMITLVTQPRRSLFGQLREWGVERNEIGKAVYDAWQAVERRFPGVRATYNAIMPDHFHGIVYVTRDGLADLEEVVAWFAAECERRAGRRLWAPLWRDSICLARGQLDRQIYYVLSNAKRRWIKDNNPGLFRKVLGFRHWRLTRATARLVEIGDVDQWDYRTEIVDEGRECWDLESGDEILKPRRANRLQSAFASGERQHAHDNKLVPDGGQHARDNKDREIAWTAVGNPFLLDEQLLLSVRISRTASPQTLDSVLERLRGKAERGAVLVGAFISPGEKAAKTAALESGGCIVQVIPEGMGRYFKPSGRDFDVCAAGRLLVLSPFAPKPGGQVERSHYGKARFEALNLASEAIADFAVNVKRVE